MDIWTTPKKEKLLTELFSLDIPPFGKNGDIKQHNKTVGHVDNFTGLTITNEKLAGQIKGTGKFCCWE